VFTRYLLRTPTCRAEEQRLRQRSRQLSRYLSRYPNLLRPIGADFFLPTAKDKLPPSPFKSRLRHKIINTARESGGKLPSGVWGEAPADKRFGAYWSQKLQLWWQQFLLIFLRTDVIFCTKTNLISYMRVQLLTGRRRPVRSFLSGGSRHHCRMEVGAYAAAAVWRTHATCYSTDSMMTKCRLNPSSRFDTTRRYVTDRRTHAQPKDDSI